MKHSPTILMMGVLVFLMAGCESAQHSAAGFRLPDDGDAARGKATFIALECNSCHSVAGVDLPRPAVLPPVAVVLGGETPKPMSDGYLVTSIINPSHRVIKQASRTADGKSQMPSRDELTMRQLTDIVAFLQTTYVVRMPQSKYPSI